MADASSCPEDTNSTDCLLRALLQRIDNHFEEFNWDPITFGFTVPIGIIAALFAAFTIYQAIIISAGRGSRKSNKRAIGEWSSKTTKGWDWHELCRISIAQTPILTTSNILNTLSPYMQVDSATGQESSKAPSDDPSVASWFEFLGALGPDSSQLEQTPRKMVIADDLPDDLLAVPAYGEVGFIVAAAAAAGAYSWKIDTLSGYPTVMGRSFQFEFRQHQTFGMIGAFIRHNYDLGTQHPPTVGQLRTALLQARGDLEANRFSSRDFRAGLDDAALHFNVLDDSARRTIAFLRRRLLDPAHNCKSGLCSCDGLFSFREDRHHLSWFFLAKTPIRPPVIFPSELIKNANVFKFLAFHSNFWASLETKRLFFSVDKITQPPNLVPDEQWDNKDLPTPLSHKEIDGDLLLLDAQRKRKKQEEETTPRDYRPVFIIFGIILEASIKFIYDMNNFRAWFKHLQHFTQQYIRVLTLRQLIEIDARLARYGSQKLFCETVSLSVTTLALLDVDSALSNGSFEPSVPEDKKHSAWTEDFCPKDDISFPYLGTLRTLDQLINEVAELDRYEMNENAKFRVKGKTDDEMTPTERMDCGSMRAKLRKHAPILGYLTHISPVHRGYRLVSCSDEINTLLRALESFLRRRQTSISSNMALMGDEQLPEELHSKQEVSHAEVPEGNHDDIMVDKLIREEGGPEKLQTEKPDRMPDKPDEDTIRDLLIWRCILIGILFSTAPDNSELLLSGVWERVVRII